MIRKNMIRMRRNWIPERYRYGFPKEIWKETLNNCLRSS